MHLIDLVKNNDIDNLKLLLENDNFNNINETDEYGFTTLMIASYRQHKDIVELLLKYNADINIQCYDRCHTELILACIRRNKDIVELLLEYDADINIRNKDDNTALILANKNKFYDIKQLLLNYLYKCVYIINIYIYIIKSSLL